MLQQQQFTTSDSIQQQHYNESYETKLCFIFCEHSAINAITITGMMILLMGISTLMIACCVTSRRQKEKKSKPDAVISKSYRQFGQPMGTTTTRMKPNISGASSASAYAGGGRMESRPLRNLSAESDVSRSMVGTQTNSISDDIFVSHSSTA